MKIKFIYHNQEYPVQSGQRIEEIIQKMLPEWDRKALAAYVNNHPVSLNYKLDQDGAELDFVTLQSHRGQMIYRASTCFLLHRVIFELFRNSRIVQGTSLGNSIYYDFYTDIPVDEALLKAIAIRMRELVAAREPFESYGMEKEEAIKFFRQRGFFDKVKLIEQQDKDYIFIHSCGLYKDLEYGPLVPDAGYIRQFWLKRYNQGLVLCFMPEEEKEHYLIQLGKRARLFNAFVESKGWGKIVGINNVYRLNDVIMSGRIQEMINICEGLHEKKIAQIADLIVKGKDRQPSRIVLIAGPSSSGKTTFTRRLDIHLRINGMKPVYISLDNYYIDREKTPRDEFGQYDFESVMALDLDLLNHHLKELINGNEVEMPIFDFEIGKRKQKTKPLRVDEYQPLILEGIHALNPLLTESIEESLKYKIYISALTPLAIDDYNRISSTDNRLIRRMIRDYKYRNYSALQTIRQWPSVRRGEEKYIFPFQEEADILFNSAHHFELPVLKTEAEIILSHLQPDNEEYRTAHRLLRFLSIFKTIDSELIPKNSLLREFIGGSCFHYD
ncbi:MAG: nucleoside kinase [Candidatus Delongbacteria bacterium]|nr:nucleoside kinase [Candidatus Delongbacteria bacterium]